MLIQCVVVGSVCAALGMMFGFARGRASADPIIKAADSTVEMWRKQRDEWAKEADAWHIGYSLHLAALRLGDDQEIRVNERHVNLIADAPTSNVRVHDGLRFTWHRPSSDVAVVKKS